jgi:anti-sigma B factor antagonist
MTTSTDTFVRTIRSSTCTPRTWLSTQTRHADAVAIVDVDGEVDSISSATFGIAADGALESAPAGLVLDLSGVTFCACAGLTVLLDIADRARRSGTPLRLVCTGRAVLRPLHLTGLANEFEIRSSLGHALEDISAPV